MNGKNLQCLLGMKQEGDKSVSLGHATKCNTELSAFFADVVIPS